MTETWRQPYPELFFVDTRAATPALFSVVEVVVPRGKKLVLDWLALISGGNDVRVAPAISTQITANLATTGQQVTHPNGIMLLGRSGTRGDVGVFGTLTRDTFGSLGIIPRGMIIDGNDTPFLTFICQTANVAMTISLHGRLVEASAELTDLLQ